MDPAEGVHADDLELHPNSAPAETPLIDHIASFAYDNPTHGDGSATVSQWHFALWLAGDEPKDASSNGVEVEVTYPAAGQAPAGLPSYLPIAAALGPHGNPTASSSSHRQISPVSHP